MEALCIFPGSFDPITLGHVDLIRRAKAIFPRVTVAVLINPDKAGTFSVAERVEMIREACRDIPDVEVDAFSGLLADYVRLKGAQVILRGVRTVADFEAESQMAHINRTLSQVETLFLPASPEYGSISSSLVRQVAMFGGDISALVPGAICSKVTRRLNKQS